MWDFFTQYQTYFIWLSFASIFLFVVSVLATPYFIKRIPVDYFLTSYQAKPSSKLKVLFKNILGIVLLVLGIIMLVAPGQGILTILFGLFLMEFRQKRLLEQKLITKDGVFKTLNWLREKSHCQPLKR